MMNNVTVGVVYHQDLRFLLQIVREALKATSHLVLMSYLADLAMLPLAVFLLMLVKSI